MFGLSVRTIVHLELKRVARVMSHPRMEAIYALQVCIRGTAQRRYRLGSRPCVVWRRRVMNYHHKQPWRDTPGETAAMF